MFRASPLSDCTRATLQAMNQMQDRSLSGSSVKLSKTKRHNPYANKVLAPEDSVEYSSMLNSPLSVHSSPLNWEARAFDPSFMYNGVSSPYFVQSLASLSIDRRVRRSLFDDSAAPPMGTSPSDASTDLGTSPSQVPAAPAKQMTLTSTPKTVPGKVYVDGRPVVVPQYDNEVVVRLRHSEGIFVIPDMHSLMASVVDKRDLVELPVIVEGDRGEDFGVIRSMVIKGTSVPTTPPSPQTEGSAAGAAAEAARVSPNSTPIPRPKVLRVASPAELQDSDTLPKWEAEALEYCQSCLQEVHLSVPITIEGVVFQFDRKKLTVRYTSDAYVDFNDLTRMLHKKYSCRIWMDQLNRETVNNTEKRVRRVEQSGKKNNSHYKGAAKRREQ